MSNELKDIVPYANLAESFEDSNPLFTYYLRKYSIQKVRMADLRRPTKCSQPLRPATRLRRRA